MTYVDVSMKVLKRSGETEDVSFDKVLQRMKNLCTGFGKADLEVDVYDISQKVCARIYNNVATSELDELAAQICSSLIVNHPDYGELASRIIVSNHHKNTSPSFTETVTILYNNKDVDGEPCPLVSDELYEVALKNKEKLNSYLDYTRDFEFDYFGFKTLERAYLLKVKGVTVERPQHMFMRVALGIHAGDIKDALQMYDLMSKKFYIHATPTLFNSGTRRPQLSSCFLLSSSDSIEGIYDTLKECANISKYAGGIGMHIHSIRAKGSKIRGTNGNSTGIVPMLRVFNNTARYVNQSGKRNGSIAVYLEPWHADVEGFLDLRKPHGNEEERTRDLFLALWIPDLFMKRVQENGVWSLMCPDECKGLQDTYGADFEALYTKYESEGKYIKQVPAQKVWFKILESQIESGQPYLLYKDACNSKSNQKNLGVIKSSNLCVAPETKILTKDGYIPIKDLHGQSVEVWNGQEFSNTVVHQTGRMQKLLTVGCSNGMELRCTPYHKFFVCDKYNPSQTIEVEARNLTLDMKIIKHAFPIINTYTRTMSNAYTYGMFCARGTYDNNGKPEIALPASYTDLLPYIAKEYQHMHSNGSATVGIKYIETTFFVPVNYSVETKVQWLSGFVDGCCAVEPSAKFYVSSSYSKFMKDVLMLLQTLGVHASIVKCSATNGYRIYFDQNMLQRLVPLGFSPKKYPCLNMQQHTVAEQYEHITITKVEDRDEYDDTYCFNEPLRHAGVFNGVLTSQCTEIVEYTSEEETAVCNLASIALPSFVKQGDDGTPYVDHKHLHEVTKVITKNLNKVIDVTFYPVSKARVSNLRHRPIGIGVQGLADMFVLMNAAFDSPEAIAINRDVFETIYHASLEASMEIAKKRHQYSMELRTLTTGEADARWSEIQTYLKLNEFDPKPMTAAFPGAYISFEGSPTSKGIFQFDMWNVTPSSRYDWESLKKDVMTYGVRNSLLLAPMPTASTSQIIGFNECIEPFTSNMYKRKTLAGEFIVINKYLIKELIRLGVWNKELKDQIIIHDGSIQNIPQIPEKIKELFKTVWELKQKTMIDMAADRAAYICQSQSLNLFMEDPDFKKLSSMHFYSWKKGLKTGIYYLRSKAKAQAQKFTIDPTLNKLTNLKQNNKTVVCTDEVCTVCSA